MYRKNQKVKSQRFRSLLKPVLIALAVLLIVFIVLRIFNRDDATNDQADGPTAEQLQQAADVDVDNKKEFLEGSEKEDPGADEPAPPPAASGSIDLAANQEADSSVTIIAKLPGVSSGNCALSISNGAKKLTRNADIIYQPEFSTCAGFNVPVSELGTGTWTISLTLSGAATSSKTITLGVQ